MRIGSKASTVILAAAVLAGCGSRNDQANGTGSSANAVAAAPAGNAVVAAPVPDAGTNEAGMANQAAVGDTGANAAAPAEDWAGRYESESADVTIRRGSGENRYRVTIDVGTPGCAGAVEGDAVARGSRLTLTARSEDVEGACTVTLRRAGPRIEVEEGPGCLPFHGASCGFDTSLRRTR